MFECPFPDLVWGQQGSGYSDLSHMNARVSKDPTILEARDDGDDGNDSPTPERCQSPPDLR